jgi:hypothetical protein
MRTRRMIVLLMLLAISYSEDSSTNFEVLQIVRTEEAGYHRKRVYVPHYTEQRKAVIRMCNSCEGS